MPRYRITRKETVVRFYAVDADHTEDAINKLQANDPSVEIEGEGMEYSSTEVEQL